MGKRKDISPEGVQHVPLWHKNYLEQKACEVPKELSCHKPPPQEQPGKVDSSPPWRRSLHNRSKQTSRKLCCCPSILLKAHLCFSKVICFPVSALSPPPPSLFRYLRSHLYSCKCPSFSSLPFNMVYWPPIPAILLSDIFL